LGLAGLDPSPPRRLVHHRSFGLRPLPILLIIASFAIASYAITIARGTSAFATTTTTVITT
jgi:hypothetical protein